MGELLVLIDHSGGTVRKVSWQMLTAARGLAEATGDEVAAVWLGPGVDEVVDDLGAHGAAKVYHWDSGDAQAYVTVPQVEALERVLADSGADTLLFASSNHVKDVAARLAVRVGAGVITDVTDLEIDDGRPVATKEVFGGDLITRCRVADGMPAFLGVGANAFVAEPVDAQGAPKVVAVEVELSEAARAARVDAVENQASGQRPDIAEAAVVVAGGRGLGDAAGFELIEQLADVMGAGVGASRAATDAGWYPHRHQIGQTGRTISPTLYLGAGISGAIQHRAGMQTSQNVVAINKDPEAPIFQIADFGVVGDLYQVVPKLIEELESRKG